MSYIKFCGLFRNEDIEYANILKPNYIGFVYAQSRRKVTLEKSAYLKSKLHENIKSVGVFLNNTMEEIVNICNENIIDMVQLHGEYSSEIIKTIKEKTGKEVIAAINIKSEDDILSLNNIEADYVLLDGAKAGSGVTFDYSLLDKAIKKGINKKYFLAGGLNINNIHKALSYNPYAIDISSGIEKDGVKDFHLMQEIIKIVKGESI